MTDNNSRYDIHSVYSGNYFCNICFHKLHNFHTFIDIIFTILCAPVPRISLTLWPPKLTGPALGAGLLGIGQNGLLVMLPQLVSLTGLSLSVWAGLLMFGSMLFLPASPRWGRQSERHGCKIVMLASLGGYLASFVVMALVVWAMANGALNALWGMAGWFCRACCTA